MNDPRSEVDRSDRNLRLIWSLMAQKKSNFQSQNPDLDWLKEMQPKSFNPGELNLQKQRLKPACKMWTNG